MVEQTDQLSRDRESGDDASGGSTVGRAVRSGLGSVGSRVGGGLRSGVGGVGSRVGDLFSVPAFLASLAVLAVGLVAGGHLLPVVGGLVGMLVAGVVVGLAGVRVVEAGTAGGVVGALSLLLSNPALSVVLGFGVPVAIVGAGSGLLVAGLGAYLGGDVRDGLTREL